MSTEVTDVTDELKEQIVEFFRQKNKLLTSRDVAGALSVEHRIIKKAITDLINDGVLEFSSFGGATFIKLIA